jgi:GT2 family glycosyltransferase
MSMLEPVGQVLLNEVLAVLVLFRTELSTAESCKTLAASCADAGMVLDLFVYDNSPESQNIVDCHRPLSITYHHDPTNAGVSAAFNAGARLARKQGKQWLLLLDQDTSFPPEAMTVYLAAIRSGGEAMFVPQLVTGTKLLSPCGYRAGIGFHLSGVTPGTMNLSGRSVLNSGLLMRLADFEASGGYDERVRVDFADFAFINRFRLRYSEVMVLDLVCRHGFSNLETPEMEAALHRYAGYCQDGRAAAVTLLLLLTHGFLVLRRAMVLTLRYGSLRFLSKLPTYFSPGQRAFYS